MLDVVMRQGGEQETGAVDGKPLDILVVGAGVAGIAAARDIQKKAPDLTFAIIEARKALGGTWDLFRYPGVRSDSDLQTLAYSDRPVFNGAFTGEGADVLAYVRDAARESGVDRKILFEHRVVAADFDSLSGFWRVDVAIGEDRRPARMNCRFLYACCGYYDYSTGHAPDFPGRADFSGPVIHPQFWPSDFDPREKRIVVIGSGATAISLIPALAARAKHVVMMQRSPTYLLPMPAKDYAARLYRRILPDRFAYSLLRWRNIFVTFGLYRLARARPALSRRLLLGFARRRLGLDDSRMADFTPRYDVWDQRVCVDSGFAFYNCLRDGSASVVTAEIDSFAPEGVRLRNGDVLRADAVVTATGLKLQAFGGARLSVDGKVLEPGDLVTYRGCMFAGAPNLFAAIGYVNASWTLKCQLTTIYLLRLTRELAARKAKWVAPQNPPAAVGPVLALTSGYVARGTAEMPKQGATWPWKYSVNYFNDLWALRYARLDDGVVHFEPA